MPHYRRGGWSRTKTAASPSTRPPRARLLPRPAQRMPAPSVPRGRASASARGTRSTCRMRAAEPAGCASPSRSAACGRTARPFPALRPTALSSSCSSARLRHPSSGLRRAAARSGTCTCSSRHGAPCFRTTNLRACGALGWRRRRAASRRACGASATATRTCSARPCSSAPTTRAICSPSKSGAWSAHPTRRRATRRRRSARGGPSLRPRGSRAWLATRARRRSSDCCPTSCSAWESSRRSRLQRQPSGG
mmetsp:Transcript_45424/g.147617  ORF Transcript_45424/g.147617 Transcript_45424/m.147617 type:complete len:250 (+) Transcript_45424:130-879(+)